MTKPTYTQLRFLISDPQGLHARAVVCLLQLLEACPGFLRFEAKGQSLQGTALLMGIMALALKQGDIFTLCFASDTSAEPATATGSDSRPTAASAATWAAPVSTLAPALAAQGIAELLDPTPSAE